MRNLLSKKEVLILEQAVEWNKSALGMLTNAVLRPISWLKGSIKRGVKKQQINTLVKQWGIEYVKAIHEVDKGEETSNSPEGFDSEPDILSDTDKTKLLPVIEKEFAALKAVKNDIQSIGTWTNIDTKNKEFAVIKAKPSIKTKINSNNLEDILNKSVNIKNIGDYKKDTITVNTFLDSINKSETVRDFINHSKGIGYVNKAIKTFLIALDDLLDTYELVTAELKNEEIGASKPDNATAPQQNNKTILKTGDTIKYTKKDGSEGVGKIDDQTGVNKGFVKIKVGTASFVIKKSQIKAKVNESYFIINEASEYSLPARIENLLSPDDLERVKQIPDIKKKTYEHVNLIRLNTLLYEANYIINKAKTNANKNDKDDQSTVLQRLWDVGIQNTNDYLQDVIDVQKVMSQVKGTTDANTKKQIEEDQVKLDDYQKMNITETFPVGQKFDINRLYAFDGIFTGQNGKAVKVLLLMSPTVEFVEDVNSAKFYWFKVFGAYRFNAKTNKVERYNFFTNITQNKEIIINFNNKENAYYMAFRNLRPSVNASNLWIYSNKGGFFFNNTLKNNVDDVKLDVLNYKRDTFDKSTKEIAKVSNVFKFKIEQRFVLDDEYVNLNKYPGIQLKDLKSDQGVDNAKLNHEKLLKYLTV